MVTYILRRGLQMMLVLFLFMTLTFWIFYLTPGDSIHKWTGDPDFSPEMVQQIRAGFGLDAPWYHQYFRYLQNLISGNLGISFSYYPRSVGELVREAFGRTLILFVTGHLLAGLLGIWLGKWVGWKKGSWLEGLGMLVGVISSTFFYPLAILLILWFFAYQLGWFPLGGLITPLLWRNVPVGITVNRLMALLIFAGGGLLVLWQVGQRMKSWWRWPSWFSQFFLPGCYLLFWVGWIVRGGFGLYLWDLISHLVLPVLTIILFSFGGTMLLMQDSMVDCVGGDVVRLARAKGLPPHLICNRHAARIAILPVMTHLSLEVGISIGGSLVTEVLFSWPGLGSLLWKATVEQDLPLALGAWTWIGIFALVAHLVADLLLVLLDPRIGQREERSMVS